MSDLNNSSGEEKNEGWIETHVEGVDHVECTWMSLRHDVYYTFDKDFINICFICIVNKSEFRLRMCK